MDETRHASPFHPGRNVPSAKRFKLTLHTTGRSNTALVGLLSRIRQALTAFTEQRLHPALAGAAADLGSWARYIVKPWLRRLGREIQAAVLGGWGSTATWIRLVLLAIAGIGVLCIASSLGRLLVGFWHHTMIGEHHGGIIATVTHPVHTYITTHAAGIPTDPATLWALWQVAAPVIFTAAAFHFRTARVLWVAYCAATAAMVWESTPQTGRPIATALAVALWLITSSVALRGTQLPFPFSVCLHLHPGAQSSTPDTGPSHPPAARAENSGGSQPNAALS